MNVVLRNSLASRSRSLQSLLGRFFGGGTKQNFYKDFGYPEALTFNDFYRMYVRNGLATAAVDRTVLKTWETNPWLLEQQSEDREDETPLEEQVRRHFAKIRFWQMLIEADRRSLVGEYGAVILRVADGRFMREPVAPGSLRSLEDLVEVIPVWQGQLEVSSWVTDERDPDYGKPQLFQFHETATGKTTQHVRKFEVHPSRVVVWSKDGTVFGKSLLQPGYNDLLDLMKISGAGGEGFWKNAKSAPVLGIDPEANIDNLARMLGVDDPSKIADKMGEVVANWQTGLDELLMLQGIEAKTLQVSLPSPEHFHRIPLQSFAASIVMPMKILVGSQTGERASTEDANEWNTTMTSRRTNEVIPNIMAVVERLVEFGVLPPRDWSLDWLDLTESSPTEKVERANKLSEINARESTLGQPAFTNDEIRVAAGFEPFTEKQLRELEDLEDDDPPDDPPPDDPNPEEEDGQ